MKDVIYKSVKKNQSRDFLGKITLKPGQNGEPDTRELSKFTYGEIMGLSEKVGSYLLNNKMEYAEPDLNMKLIGIFAKNRYEWIVADIACMLYGLTIVPLYDTLGI